MIWIKSTKFQSNKDRKHAIIITMIVIIIYFLIYLLQKTTRSI